MNRVLHDIVASFAAAPGAQSATNSSTNKDRGSFRALLAELAPVSTRSRGSQSNSANRLGQPRESQETIASSWMDDSARSASYQSSIADDASIRRSISHEEPPLARDEQPTTRDEDRQAWSGLFQQSPNQPIDRSENNVDDAAGEPIDPMIASVTDRVGDPGLSSDAALEEQPLTTLSTNESALDWEDAWRQLMAGGASQDSADTSLDESWSGAPADQQLIANGWPTEITANSVVQDGSIPLAPSSGRGSAIGLSSALSDHANGTNGLPASSNLLKQSSVIVEHDANAASDQPMVNESFESAFVPALNKISTRSSDEVRSADQWPADDAMLQSVRDPLSQQEMQTRPRSIVAVGSGIASQGKLKSGSSSVSDTTTIPDKHLATSAFADDKIAGSVNSSLNDDVSDQSERPEADRTAQVALASKGTSELNALMMQASAVSAQSQAKVVETDELSRTTLTSLSSKADSARISQVPTTAGSSRMARSLIALDDPKTAGDHLNQLTGKAEAGSQGTANVPMSFDQLMSKLDQSASELEAAHDSGKRPQSGSDRAFGFGTGSTAASLINETSVASERSRQFLADWDQAGFRTELLSALERAPSDAPNQVKIAISPPELGPITLTVDRRVDQQTGERFVARIEARDESVSRWLQAETVRMHDHLSRKGLVFDAIVIAGSSAESSRPSMINAPTGSSNTGQFDQSKQFDQAKQAGDQSARQDGKPERGSSAGQPYQQANEQTSEQSRRDQERLRETLAEQRLAPSARRSFIDSLMQQTGG